MPESFAKQLARLSGEVMDKGWLIKGLIGLPIRTYIYIHIYIYKYIYRQRQTDKQKDKESTIEKETEKETQQDAALHLSTYHLPETVLS